MVLVQLVRNGSVGCNPSAERRVKKVCLTMIVKNEAHIIAKTLESVKDLIDRWVIVDRSEADPGGDSRDVLANALARFR
jgi:hypothetical protein